MAKPRARIDMVMVDIEDKNIAQHPEREGILASFDIKGDTPMHIVWGIVSSIALPMLCPVYAAILAFTQTVLQFLPVYTKFVYIILTFIINVVLPIAIFVFLKKAGVITDIGVNRRRERTIPYIIAICCMVSTVLLFWQKGAPQWLLMFYVGATVALFVLTIINLKWKISAHATGVAGLVALLVCMTKTGSYSNNLVWWVLGMIMFAGLVGTARVYLRRHTILQVLAGWVCGFASVYLCMLLSA